MSNRISSTALEASHVLSTTPCKLTSLKGYNSKSSAQFIQLHDAAAVPGDAAAEVFTVDFNGATPAGLANKYLLAADAAGSVYFWFNLDSGGVDPAPAGIARGIAVAITTGNSDTQLATAFAAVSDSAFTLSRTNKVVQVTNTATGARTDAAAGTSGLGIATTTQGVTVAVPFFTATVAASSNFSFDFASGMPCGALSVCNSSAAATKVGGSADCFFTAVLG
ncbi:MAG: hypothetical protein KGL39_48395 [Patescibacteria group bacterium]|nr:hypothetical protein [Patescibacteria group bacterium]